MLWRWMKQRSSIEVNLVVNRRQKNQCKMSLQQKLKFCQKTSCQCFVFCIISHAINLAVFSYLNLVIATEFLSFLVLPSNAHLFNIIFLIYSQCHFGNVDLYLGAISFHTLFIVFERIKGLIFYDSMQLFSAFGWSEIPVFWVRILCMVSWCTVHDF